MWGVEPTTSRLQITCSSQLSYSPVTLLRKQSAQLQALRLEEQVSRHTYRPLGDSSGPNGSRTRVQTTLVTRITCVSFLLHQLVSSSIQIVFIEELDSLQADSSSTFPLNYTTNYQTQRTRGLFSTTPFTLENAYL